LKYSQVLNGGCCVHQHCLGQHRWWMRPFSHRCLHSAFGTFGRLNGKNVVKILECWRVGTLESWRVGKLEGWNVGVLACWNVGVLACWNVCVLACGMLECWNVGVLVCWTVGVLACWRVGMLECWNVGVLGARNTPCWEPEAYTRGHIDTTHRDQCVK
jgi:hypothetical protein